MRFFNRVFCVALIALWSVAAASAQTPELKFNSDHKFKIVQFTDVHWVYNNPASDIAGERMAEVLDAEKPDLVVFTGDVVFAKPARLALDKALEATIERGIPFAITWGNHDDEHDMSRKELTDYVATKPNCLISSAKGIPGTANYTLNIGSSNGDATAAAIYIFDSNSYSTLNLIKGYGWIRHEQVEWYRKASAAFTSSNNGTPLPALAFFHIPLPEFHEAVRNESTMLVGTRKETACSPAINTGLGAAMLECGDVMGVFVGHDHVNDYAAEWNGILLAYGRYSGGNTVYNDIPGGNGARIIELTEGEKGFKTWIRIKDGQTINHINHPADAK